MRYPTRLLTFAKQKIPTRNIPVILFVAIFAVAGLSALLISKASTTQVSVEAESGAIAGNARKVTGSHVVFDKGAEQPSKGVQLIWPQAGDQTQTALEFVNGGQIVFDWKSIEPSNGEFCWNNPVVWNLDAAGMPISRKEGCGTSKSNSNAGLESKLSYLKTINKPATIQVNSSQKPQWLYDNPSIVKCGTRGVPFYPDRPPYDVPQYWKLDGTLNEAYFNEMETMLESLATSINTSSNKNLVMGIRSAPNLIGTEHFDINESNVTITNAAAVCQKTAAPGDSGFTSALGKKGYVRAVAKTDKIMRAKGIRTILRLVAITSLGDGDGGIRCTAGETNDRCTAKYLEPDENGLQSWFFNTSSEPDEAKFNKADFMYRWAREGCKNPPSCTEKLWGIAFHEALLGSNRFNHPVSWNYWRILSEIDRGTSYIAVYGTDIAQHTNPEYRAAFDFGNKYAGYNMSNADKSPGAWIAFAPGENTEDDTCRTHGNLGLYITQTDSSSTGLSSSNTGSCATDPAFNCEVPDNPATTCKIIGSLTQRFGRWARKTSGIISLRLDSSFKESLSGNTKVRVTYLDLGGGNFKLRWNGGESAIAKANTGNWKTSGDITVPSAALKSGDIELSTGGSETTFHMVEIIR